MKDKFNKSFKHSIEFNELSRVTYSSPMLGCVVPYIYLDTGQTSNFSYGASQSMAYPHVYIGYISIELDAKYFYNATSYKSFISKVYDLVGKPSYDWSSFYLQTSLPS